MINHSQDVSLWACDGIAIIINDIVKLYIVVPYKAIHSLFKLIQVIVGSVVIDQRYIKIVYSQPQPRVTEGVKVLSV